MTNSYHCFTSQLKYLLIFLVAVIMAVSSGCHGRQLRQHPDFKARPSQFRTIAVLEPHFENTTKSFFAEVKHSDSSDPGFIKTRTTFSESIATLLQLNGFAAIKLDATEMSASGLQKLLGSHLEISSRVFNVEKGVVVDLRDIVATLPVDIRTSAGDSPVDAFLYSYYKRWCKTQTTAFTQQMLLFAVAAAGGSTTAPANNMCGSNAEVILIRATTMEILWANRISSQAIVTELVAESVLKKFPRVNSAALK